MLSQRRLALRKRLRMRHDTRHAVQRAGLGHQIVMNFYRALAQNLKGRAQQQVERAIDSSFRGVLDRNHAHIRLARPDRAKNFTEGVAAQASHGMSEQLRRSLVGKRTLRAQLSTRTYDFEYLPGR